MIGSSVIGAQLAFMKALADIGKRDGVQVNSINPGSVDTDRFRHRLGIVMQRTGLDEAAAIEHHRKELDITRFGRPEDIAGLVAFVVSPRGRWLHGAAIDMDGGQVEPLRMSEIRLNKMSNVRPTCQLSRQRNRRRDAAAAGPGRGRDLYSRARPGRSQSFGLVVIDADGNVAAGGDSDTPFSIQSISKVFTLTLALGKVGDRLWQRVGREPSGSAVQLHRPARIRAAASRAIPSSMPARSPSPT